MDKKKKADFISNSYGDLWPLVKDLVDDNGFINYDELSPGPNVNTPSDKVYDHLYASDNIQTNIFGFRPLSLLELENNNGWLCVNNKSDLPKYDCLVKVCFEGKVNSIVYQWHSGPGLLEATQQDIRGYVSSPYKFWINTISHYKIYTADLPPMY